MKILLTGATGFLGFRTLETLVQNENVEHIVATGRQLKPVHTVHHPKIEYRLGDLSNVDFTEVVCNNVDAIIHAAGLSSPWGAYGDFYQANVIGQKNLIAAAIQNNIKRYIYISTPSIYYNGKDRLDIKETDPLPTRFVNAYATTKYLAELELQKSALEHIILRPRALVGRGDTVILPRLIKAHLGGKLKIIGDGKNIIDLTDVGNAARAIELSLFAKGEALNQVYNISNGTPVLIWQYVAKILSELGYPFEAKKIPYWLIKQVAAVLELKAKLTNNKEPVLTLYGIGTLAKSCTLNISKAQHLLGYEAVTPLDQSLKEFVSWYNEAK